MSVEIRLAADGKHLECDWGVFTNSEADPRKGISTLILVTPEHIDELRRDGPSPHKGGGTSSMSHHNGGSPLLHLDVGNFRFSWELYEAHWWDNDGPPILVGRMATPFRVEIQ